MRNVAWSGSFRNNNNLPQLCKNAKAAACQKKQPISKVIFGVSTKHYGFIRGSWGGGFCGSAERCRLMYKKYFQRVPDLSQFLKWTLPAMFLDPAHKLHFKLCSLDVILQKLSRVPCWGFTESNLLSDALTPETLLPTELLNNLFR